MSQKLPNQHRPCSNCPFRKDCKKGWLGKNRIEEILSARSFSCHKTTGGAERKRKQCAGHMLVNRYENEFYSLAIRMGLSEELNLSGEELVFDNKPDLIQHHKMEFEE